MLIRQGDVNIAIEGTKLNDGTVVGPMPVGAEPINSPIVARGEFSGHCHAIRKPKDAPGGLMAHGQEMWIDAGGGLHIDHTHETYLGAAVPARAEHHPIELPANTSGKVLIEREYEPDGLRLAAD